ncbi:hypothetical protein [Aliiroseovarius crassostreae]|uniref:hypothetical protein n=1 Tax=Aliiroseovarius crassostreae TaxID=154981 RepID=UPI003C7B40FA
MSALLTKTGVKNVAGKAAIRLWSLSGGDERKNTFHQKENNADDPRGGVRMARTVVMSKGIN